MPSTSVTLLMYCVLVIVASLIGGWLPLMIRLTHARMQVMISLVAGVMLGVGIFHMLPHAAGELDSIDQVAAWMMAGLLSMFFLIRAFHFHQHGQAELPEMAHDDHQHGGHQHGPECHHDHGHAHDCGHDHAPGKNMNWFGVMLGLSLHTLMDGIAMAASVYAEEAVHTGGWLLGFGTFLAVFLHKPLDAVSITTLMTAGGWSASSRHIVNASFAMMCPVGALIFALGLNRYAGPENLVLGAALAFSAGVFLCISLGDLLPEVNFHSHDRVKLSVALLVGVALAYSIGFLEPEHLHSHGPAGAHVGHDHSHHNHSHAKP